MQTIYSLEIASQLHQEFERMSTVPVRISSFGKIYEIQGDGFSAKIEAEELKQICPNKRLSGKVIQTIGETPLMVGETVQMIFAERGTETKIKINLSSMTPEVMIKRFLREGEIVEAERIIKKQHLLMKYGGTGAFISVVLVSILSGVYDTWKPILICLLFSGILFYLDWLFRNQIKQVID